MKTITITAYNRPAYLQLMLSSLRANSMQDYTLFVGVDPGCNEVIEMARAINFIDAHVHINKEVLGVRQNPFTTLERAFNKGSCFNVALEDDLLLAPDAFDLAEWYRQEHSNSTLCLGLMNYHSNPEFPDAMMLTRYFTPLGWATSKENWSKYFSKWWMHDIRGWDFSISQLLDTTPELFTVHPRLSRSNHLGRDAGTYCTPEYHDKRFGNLIMSDGRFRAYHL